MKRFLKQYTHKKLFLTMGMGREGKASPVRPTRLVRTHPRCLVLRPTKLGKLTEFLFVLVNIKGLLLQLPTYGAFSVDRTHL